MKSLKIVFESSGARLLLDETVENFDAVVQNGLVNIATEKGSDKGDPARGTNLLRDALQGRIADLLTAQHISNLAALDTLFYLRNSDERETTEERVDKLALQPFEYDGALLRVNALFTGTQGTVTGRDTTI
jgi:hypothetical protein